MAEQNASVSVSVVAFGPLKDEIAQNQIVILDNNSTIEHLIRILKIEKWLDQGLTVALNGNRCW